MARDPTSSRKRLASVVALCVILWIVGLIFLLYGTWLALVRPPDFVPFTALSLGVGVFSMAAGVGLYLNRRWGVVLFGGLSLAGSISHLANMILNFPNLSASGLTEAVEGIISVLGGVLIPFGLIYLTLMLWKQAD